MDLWMTEYQTPNLGLSCRIKETLYSGKSEFQDIAIVDSHEFGRMLVLDGVFQTSVFDEYIYHEMIAHVPLCTHPAPKKVLVIGGGDGGTVREAVKHQDVDIIKMVEIDGLVVDVSKKFLPEISIALRENHPKVDLTIGDGIQHMHDVESEYDVIIVDCSDPIGPGEGLFTYQFYTDVYKALKQDGLFVQQTESPFYHQPLIKRLYKDISSLFPITQLYLASIPLYPGGLHCFTMGSKKYRPQINSAGEVPVGMKYFNTAVYQSCFSLPEFVKDFLRSNS